ncbi:MAG TPA: 6-phosphogluconolactonase [Geobacteraceae bacterium]
MMIHVFPDAEAMSEAAADIFVDKARRSAQLRGRFAVLFAGGETPRRTYELLALPPRRDAIPWGKVHVFWGDERCVPSSDRRNNSRMARQALLDHVPVPPGQLHPIECHLAPRECAMAYEATLRSFFSGVAPRFDLVFLGLGADGHTASLFPGTPVTGEWRRWTAEVAVEGSEFERVTLTAPLINKAETVVFLVTGGNKAQVVREVIEGNADPQSLPARLIGPEDGDLVWLLDSKAARLLRKETAPG